MNSSRKKFSTVDEYINSFPSAVRSTLTKIRTTIKRAAPDAVERISYGMPFYEYGGKGYKGRLLYFAAFKNHISLFITPQNSSAVPAEMKKYNVSKATYRFELGDPFPFALLEKTIKVILLREPLIKNSVDAISASESIQLYHKNLSAADKEICDLLFNQLNKHLPKSENKLWHGHPVWFLNGNPIVGYSKQKKGIRLMFWSGADFNEDELLPGTGKFKDASIFYSNANKINIKNLKRWLSKSIAIQWDYKNIVKRKGKLIRISPH